ncbi:MAG: sigma 54-interacting transcriptional regulator, partial [Eubacterium sp.]|nr:sigma 54-interacting transcriptional regulator [Eubacterium sp.]
MEFSQLMDSALKTIPNFIVVDRAGIIVYMNQMYADMLGLPLESIIGQPVEKIVPGTKLPEVMSTGKRSTGEVMEFYHHAKEQTVRLICNRFPLWEKGTVIGAAAMTLLEDVDEINRLYQDLEKMRAENRKMQKQLQTLQDDSPLSRLIGSSAAMMDLKKNIEKFAASNLTILLTGETGVGKEVFANAIHQMSSRRMAPFIKVNCAAIPKDLLESELFGYEPGAFTGAGKTGKPGKFELADTGTLLLDEIGEMPAALQAKLLRVLQESEVERVGGTHSKKINVRVICSTNIKIQKKIAEGSFREDLYYRINTLELFIPPLRERLSDIPALCRFFIQKNNEESGLKTQGIDEAVLELFLQYEWPGNVRELRHVLERLSFLHQDSIITTEHCDFLKERIMKQADMKTAFAASVYPSQPSASITYPSPAPVLSSGLSFKQELQAA